MSGPASNGTFPTCEITGRDGSILAQTLATAYALIGTLPPECQAMSNRHDMARLLRSMLGEDWKIEAHRIRHVLSAEERRSGKAPLAPDAFENIDG